MNKVSACLIVRDELALNQCLASVVSHVSEIILVDTGTTDERALFLLKEAEQRWGAKVSKFTECNNEDGLIERFDLARAYSFSLAKQPWLMWLDADDVLAQGMALTPLVQQGEGLKKSHQAVSFMLPYEYSYDGEGHCTLRHYRERLFSADGFNWVNWIHEVCIPKPSISASITVGEAPVWQHKRQFIERVNVEAQRNLRILRKWVSTGAAEKDARISFYYGTELVNAGLFDEGIGVLSKYISNSGWDHEQFMACDKVFGIYLVKALSSTSLDEKKRNYELASNWAFRCVQCREGWAEGWLNLAKLHFHMANDLAGTFQRRNWERCIAFAKHGLSLPPTRTMLFVNPMERDILVYEYLQLAQNAIGDVPGALDSCNKALSYAPNNTNFKYNRGLYEAFNARMSIQTGIDRLRDLAKQDSRFSRLDEERYTLILQAMHDQPIAALEVAKRSSFTTNSLKAGRKVAVVCGDCWETWNPDSVKTTGIGGSELAVIEISKRLAALGNEVVVYTSCGEERVYDGVLYKPTNTLTLDSQFDVLIAWRNAPLLATAKARVKILWVHDVFAVAADQRFLLLADAVVGLSYWHRELLKHHHNLSDEQTVVIRNGIDSSRYTGKLPPRKAIRAIYSSSPDRGLMALLQMWPKISEKTLIRPELRIFYGFFNWKSMAKQNGDQAQLQLISAIEAMVSSTPGVKFIGRVSQDQLANEFLEASAWLYPTWFTETSCITAMEARAAGLNIVTSPIAALPETVGNYGVFIPGDWLSEEYQSQFIDAAVKALEGPPPTLESTAEAQMTLDWSHRVGDWEALFSSLEEKKKTNPLVPYTKARGFSR